MNQTTETINTTATSATIAPVTATSCPATASKASKPKPDPNSPWRDRKGIAAYYGKSETQIKDWQREKVIPYVKQGGNVMFHIHRCDKALDRYEIKSIGA